MLGSCDMSKIAIWFDGGGAFGFGNIRRSRELGDALALRGHEVILTPRSGRAGQLCVATGDQGVSPDLIVLDLPYNGDAAVEKARGSGAKVVALDFEGTLPPDLVISLQAVRPCPQSSRALCGVKYAIVRREIRLAGLSEGQTDEILVVVGGGDTGDLTHRIVERLPKTPVCVVQGPAGTSMLACERKDLHVVFSPPDLPQRMARCTWAVTTAGTTLLELLYLGKAVHAVPRSGAELLFVRQFQERGALLGADLATLGTPSRERIKECERLGPQLVDGLGCERIIAEIENIL